VRVRVFDLAGREVRALHDGPLPVGTHTLPFEARDLPSGTYLYQIDTRGGTQSRPMTLVR
jgi:intein/homing endonuclease